jgi:hypothetical protein
MATPPTGETLDYHFAQGDSTVSTDPGGYLPGLCFVVTLTAPLFRAHMQIKQVRRVIVILGM